MNKFESGSSVESGEGKESIERKTMMQLKAEMQGALWSKSGCDMDDIDCVEKWLKRNGDNFHIAFDNIGAKYGDMFDLWETDREAVLGHLTEELESLPAPIEKRQAA